MAERGEGTSRRVNIFRYSPLPLLSGVITCPPTSYPFELLFGEAGPRRNHTLCWRYLWLTFCGLIIGENYQFPKLHRISPDAQVLTSHPLDGTIWRAGGDPTNSSSRTIIFPRTYKGYTPFTNKPQIEDERLPSVQLLVLQDNQGEQAHPFLNNRPFSLK